MVGPRAVAREQLCPRSYELGVRQLCIYLDIYKKKLTAPSGARTRDLELMTLAL